MGKAKQMIGFFILAFIFRLLVVNQGLWLDEAIGALAAHNFSYAGIINDFLTHDNHPPLFYIFLKGWAFVFGFSDISLRLPGIIFGSILAAYVYKEIKKYSRSAFLSALFISVSPFLIYYSQEVRMYIYAAVLATISIFSYWRVSQKKSLISDWILFSLSTTALLFTDYVPVFLIPVFLIAGFIWKQNIRWWKSLLISFIPLLILGFLWIPIFVAQIHGGQTVLTFLPGWASISGGATIKEVALVWNKFLLGRISIQPTKLYALVLFVFSLPALVSLSVSFIKRDKFISLMWMWLVIPLALCFISSFIFPAFVYFRFTFVAPAFFILLADGLTKIKSIRIKFVLAVWIVAGNLFGLYYYAKVSSNQREQWREAVSFIEKNAKANSIALFEFPEAFAPYKWYSTGKVRDVGGLSEISFQPGDEKKLSNKVKDVDTIYYFNYLRDLTDPTNAIKKALPENGYRLIRENGDFQGVGIIEIWQK